MDRFSIATDESSAGRERELSLLLRAHEEGRSSGAARFALIHGPAGIGKSHLTSALKRALLQKGVRVLEGHARRGAGEALGLFASLARELLALVEEQGIAARTLAELARRLSPLTGRPSLTAVGAGRAPEEARLDLADALAELAILAGRSSPAILLHDLEAADRGSLELLRYVAAALLAPGVSAGGLFVLSYRDGLLPAPLAEVVERVPGPRLPLAGLDLQGIRAFLGRPDVAERLLDLTAGDPSRLEEVLAAPPAPLAARRLERLEPEARRLLLAAAVLGSPAPAGLYLGILGEAGSALLDRLVSARFLLLGVSAGQPAYSLARDADRLALLSSASPAELRALQLAAAEALVLSSGSPELIARHFLAADPAGRGAEWAARAAESLVGRCAFDAAIELYRAALRERPADRALHAGLSRALRASGELVGALRHAGLARRGAAPAELRALRAEAARLCVALGKLSQAEALCSKVLGVAAKVLLAAEAPPDSAAALACADLVEIRFLRGDYGGAVELGGAALARIEQPELRLQLRNTVGKAHLASGALDAALACFLENGSAAGAAGLSRELMRARINEGVVAHRRGDRRAAIACYRAGLEVGGGDRALSAFALANLGALYHEAGEFLLSLEHHGQALGAFTRSRRAKEVSHEALNLARLHLFLGDLERAEALAEHGRAEATAVGDPYLVAQAFLVRGELRESRGELAGAVSDLAEARDAFVVLRSPRYDAEAGLALCRVHLARGERQLARLELSRVESGSAARESAAVAAELELVGGELALACGELPLAARRAGRAKEILLAEPAGAGGETDLEGPVRVYHLLSRIRTAAGDPAGGAAELSRAARLLDEVTARVPPAHRQRFVAVQRRAELLAAAGEREITPGRSAAARRLEEPAAGPLSGIVGSAPALQRLTKLILPVGRSMTTVLIRGESGTGKELVAEAIHRSSPRQDQPLVKVNCAAMHEELLLSELFGHEKGAFTGAIRERRGRFELAEGGTIFLDEIGDVSPKAQVALLRVLQEREYERVGGTKTLKADVRVICATNRNLEAMIEEGRFRQDLYYRLKGVMLELPALRERLEDLPLLAAHVLERLYVARGGGPRQLSREALELLGSWSWPGNVRELENVIGAAAIFAETEVVDLAAFEAHGEFLRTLGLGARAPRAEPALPAPCPAAAPVDPLDFYEVAKGKGVGLREMRHALEIQMIRRALEEAKGNISEAARLLQMKRSRLSQIVNAEPEVRELAKGAS